MGVLDAHQKIQCLWILGRYQEVDHGRVRSLVARSPEAIRAHLAQGPMILEAGAGVTVVREVEAMIRVLGVVALVEVASEAQILLTEP